MSSPSETYVRGNQKDTDLVCITSDARPGKWHAWQRAAIHVFRDTGWDFYTRNDACSTCEKMGDFIVAEERGVPRESLGEA